jgi:hypothetical protein
MNGFVTAGGDEAMAAEIGEAEGGLTLLSGERRKRTADLLSNVVGSLGSSLTGAAACLADFLTLTGDSGMPAGTTALEAGTKEEVAASEESSTGT